MNSILFNLLSVSILFPNFRKSTVFQYAETIYILFQTNFRKACNIVWWSHFSRQFQTSEEAAPNCRTLILYFEAHCFLEEVPLQQNWAYLSTLTMTWELTDMMVCPDVLCKPRIKELLTCTNELILKWN